MRRRGFAYESGFWSIGYEFVFRLERRVAIVTINVSSRLFLIMRSLSLSVRFHNYLSMIATVNMF